jgi:hypothetical protein
MSIKIPQTKFEPIPEGVYHATISEIVQENGKFGEQLKFKFQLDPFEGNEDGKFISAWTSAKFSQKSKLYAWASAVLGKIAPEYEFDSDDLIGKQVLIVTKQRPGNDGVTMFDSIESVKAIHMATPKSAEKINTEMGVEAKEPQ